MKKIVTFILAICIMMGTGITAFADSESTGSVEALPHTGYRTIVKTNEVEATERLVAAFDAMETQVDLTDCEINADDFASLYFSALYDHPEFFYVELSYRYSYNVATNQISTVTISYLNMYTNQNGCDTAKIAADRAKFDAAVENAMSILSDEMSDVEKVLAIHEYLGSTVCYDYEDQQSNNLPETVYTAYGALVDDLAVCQGYSLAFKLLCLKNDIECLYVSSAEACHGWNMVNLDGEWYHVDLTYDDPVYTCTGRRLLYTVLNHNFFLVSDDDMDDGEHVNYTRPEHINEVAPSASETMTGIWDGQKSQMLYKDGYWYYVDGANIVKSKIDGSDMSIVVEKAGADIHMTTDGSSILYSTRKGVYAVNYDGTDLQELFVNADERIHGVYYNDGVIYAEVHSTTGEALMENITFEAAKPEEDVNEDTEADIEAPKTEAPEVENEGEISNEDLSMGNQEIAIGDMDGDGEVTVTDIIILKNLVMDENNSADVIAASDCDADGRLSVSDILFVKKIVMAA